MTESFVTQCPHCQTSFRVSRAQLGAAQGAVRCGACLHVFNAAKQLLGAMSAGELKPSTPAPQAPRPAAPAAPKPAAPVAPVAPAQPASPAPSVATLLKSPLASAPVPPPAPVPPAVPPGKTADKNTLWIHDDLDLDSLDLDEELAKLEQEELKLSQEFLALQAAPKPGEQSYGQHVESTDKHDERWAEALLREDAPRAAPSAPRPTPPAVAERPATIEPPAPQRKEPALSLNDDLDDDPAPAFGPAADRDDEPTDEPARARIGASDEEEDDEIDEPPVAPARTPPRNEPGLHGGNLLDIDDEPLQLDWQQPKKPWGRWIGWGALNLLGAIALAGQYVWYHFDELARTDQYRPWFEQLCPELGCQLPSKVEIALIKSSNLVVRSHPDFTGALVVDAILYNRASFSQPFPLLELRFADINGQLLASRRFKPGEYLAGELAGQSEMPPQTPIHISLDILDPGTKAVNYSLSFHSPE
ncbi:DUF3426 domain-containing protein [Pseudomonas sp. zfem005]|uniref:DUF3426 domain-containing protein n=1 Tax=Pseudomonas sp. zfem005 TaxID=3078200 RepID=UPI00292A32D7|nr:DUF3426 domain-containing protein [Pseudomonas sp. zfem005]MDU9411948.1 DUF3426 domain-containing protein [Pseudomonas sp. zfem005]